MSGIYIHIPFCRKLCNYCDFYRSKRMGAKDDLLECLLIEIEQKASYPDKETTDTIYIGGGTPSVLSVKEINSLFNKIYSFFDVMPDAEITFEANPDDLNCEYINDLKQYTVINRLSIGVQSFIDRDLKFLNRRHDSATAVNCVTDAAKAGFSNISIDLIYAIPGMNNEEWEYNLNRAFSLDINHLSAYHLTYEPNTVLFDMVNKRNLTPVAEENSIKQFSLLIDIAEKNKYEHYEISNFSKNGCYSKHNSNYWKGIKYLGIGPSAHSYNQVSRQWNISNNLEYIKRITNNEKYYDIEFLDTKTRFNEYVMTGLRTKWGINLDYISKAFGDQMRYQLTQNAENFIKSGKIIDNQDNYTLSRDGMLIADYIISQLFCITAELRYDN